MEAKNLKAVLGLFILAAALDFAVAGKVVCYYGSWGTYRGGNGQCDVADIDATLCTHLIYSFAGLDAATNTIKVLDTWADLPTDGGKDGYARFVALKSANPSLKTMIAIGGWNEGSYKYSVMASSASSRATFVSSVITFLQQYKFDGLDVDWEYPAGQDKQNYISLLKELRTQFDKYGFLLSAAVGVGASVVDAGYDLASMSIYLDFINLMAYDLHGGWETATAHNAPLYARPDESAANQQLNLNFSVNYFIKNGASTSKMVLGLPLYGHSFTLSNPSSHGLYAPASRPGNMGPYTQEEGTLGYNEICEKFAAGGWSVTRDPYYQAPYAYSGDQWVGYDDAESIQAKLNFAKSLGLAGAMVWSIETDDVHGACGGGKFPLLTLLHQAYGGGDSSQTTKATTTAATTKAAVDTTTTAKAADATTKATTTKATTIKTTTTAKSATTTTTSGQAVTDLNSYLQTKCQTSQLVGDPNECTKFYSCTKNGSTYTTTLFTCQSGLAYDESVQGCNWKSNVATCAK